MALPLRRKPVRKLSALVLLLAFAAAACSSGSSVVATVNGTEITLDEVEALYEAPSVTRQDFADRLFQLVLDEVVRQGGTELGVVEDQAAIDAFYTDAVARIEEEGPLEDFLQDQNGTEAWLKHFAFQEVYFPAVQSKILDDGLTDAYEQLSGAEKTLVCVRHILVATEEEAKDALARLASGEEFADLAVELSLDTGSGAVGGDLGCALAAGYVPSFADAALTSSIGEVTDPVESQFGHHVLIVDSRADQTLDDLRDQLSSQLVNGWFNDVMNGADVVVDEEYGTWETVPQFRVAAPA